jgi:hypothetical protein
MPTGVYIRTQKWREIQSKAHKGNHPKSEFKKGYHPITSFKKGYHPPTEFKKGHKCFHTKGQFKKGHQPKEEWKKNMSERMKGSKHPFFGRKGELHPNYKGGIALVRSRYKAKRRQYGSEFLNKPFPSSEGHHINCNQIVFIPKEMHLSIKHSLNNQESMENINEKVYDWMLGFPERKDGGN